MVDTARIRSISQEMSWNVHECNWTHFKNRCWLITPVRQRFAKIKLVPILSWVSVQLLVCASTQAIFVPNLTSWFLAPVGLPLITGQAQQYIARASLHSVAGAAYRPAVYIADHGCNCRLRIAVIRWRHKINKRRSHEYIHENSLFVTRWSQSRSWCSKSHTIAVTLVPIFHSHSFCGLPNWDGCWYAFFILVNSKKGDLCILFAVLRTFRIRLVMLFRVVEATPFRLVPVCIRNDVHS